jgi:cytochrome c55X
VPVRLPDPITLLRMGLATLALAQGSVQAQSAPGTDFTPAHQQALIRTVRQDCGSCHGMQLTGGLGPPLTQQALADRPLPTLVAIILYGRPGTPMPGWHSMISEPEAQWIAQQLHSGFPQERTP